MAYKIRERWIQDRDTGKLLPASEWYQKNYRPVKKAPGIICDEIPATWNHEDCRYYTSKSELRAANRRLGLTEVGDQTDYVRKLAKRPGPKELLEDAAFDRELERVVSEAYYSTRDGTNGLPEHVKERCRIQDRNLEHYNYDNRRYDEFGNLADE